MNITNIKRQGITRNERNFYMDFEFVIMDELIEDLQSGHRGKFLHVKNRVLGLKNMYLRKHDAEQVLEINRILSCFDRNDINMAITMMREYQEMIYSSYPISHYLDRDHGYHLAYNRFKDWQVSLLK